MKVLNKLLLGTAAGLVAVTAGQAAELPVKAKPVQYVKICSLYGAGFYYMPGTDMCLKIGGWVRAEVTWGINGNSSTGIFTATDYNNRYTNNFWTRERGYITADAREQTAYGVARGYIAVGISSQNNGNEAPSGNFSSNRAYVQWAGFTAGLAVSFFDFYPAAALLYRAGNLPQEDTGDGGIWIWAYTAQLGGGVSATISAEERRTSQIINAGPTAIGAPGVPGATPKGVGADCVDGVTIAAGTATNCQLSTAWEVNAAYEHHWTPQWHQSFVGAYLAHPFNSAANAMLCSAIGGGNGAGTGSAAVATAGCNMDWSFWGVGSRLQWDVTKSFYVGVEAIYQQLVSGQTFNGLSTAVLQPVNSGCPAVGCTVANESNWTFTVRMHKDFLP